MILMSGLVSGAVAVVFICVIVAAFGPEEQGGRKEENATEN